MRSRCHPVFREKLTHTKCCEGGSIVVLQKQLVSCEVLVLKFVDMSSTKLPSVLPTRRLFDDDKKHYRVANFFNVFVGSAC